jgi:hypothetical protein
MHCPVYVLLTYEQRKMQDLRPRFSERWVLLYKKLPDYFSINLVLQFEKVYQENDIICVNSQRF